MKLTAGAADLLVAAFSRSDRAKRRMALHDARIVAEPDGKRLTDLLRKLDR